LKAIFEAIDNRTDFKSYMQNYAVARGSLKGPRRDGPYDEGFVSAYKRLNCSLADISYHLYRPMCRNRLITLTRNLSNPDLPSYSLIPHKLLRMDSPAPIPHKQKPQTRLTPFWVFPLLQAIPSEWIWAHSSRGIKWKFRGYWRNVQRLSRCLVRPKLSFEEHALISGIENTGIYRLSGTTSRVQALKHALDSSTSLL
jgi:hypothetical protein